MMRLEPRDFAETVTPAADSGRPQSRESWSLAEKQSLPAADLEFADGAQSSAAAQLEIENSGLRRLVVELIVKNQQLREEALKNLRSD